MSVVEIPITQFPYYKSSHVLDGQAYTFTFRWSVRNEAWYLDIDNTVIGIKIVNGINLLDQYSYNDDLPPGKLGAYRNSGRDSKPGFTNFGVQSEITLIYEPV